MLLLADTASRSKAFGDFLIVLISAALWFLAVRLLGNAWNSYLSPWLARGREIREKNEPPLPREASDRTKQIGNAVGLIATAAAIYFFVSLPIMAAALSAGEFFGMIIVSVLWGGAYWSNRFAKPKQAWVKRAAVWSLAFCGLLLVLLIF